MFRLNSRGQMGLGERCIDSTGSGISIIYCPVQPTGPWQWDQVSSGIRLHGYQPNTLTLILLSVKFNRCKIDVLQAKLHGP